MIGQYIKIDIGGNSRPYCPVSRIDEPGIVDIIVRDTREENEKAFTAELLQLKVVFVRLRKEIRLRCSVQKLSFCIMDMVKWNGRGNL